VPGAASYSLVTGVRARHWAHWDLVVVVSACKLRSKLGRRESGEEAKLDEKQSDGLNVWQVPIMLTKYQKMAVLASMLSRETRLSASAVLTGVRGGRTTPYLATSDVERRVQRCDEADG